MFRVLQVFNGLYLLVGLYALALNRDLLPSVLLFGGILFAISSLYKGYALGFDTLRGKFWLIFSGFGLLGAGVFTGIHAVHILGRLFLLLAVLFMFLGVLSRGIRFSGWRIAASIGAFVVSTLTVLGVHLATGLHGWKLLIGAVDVVIFTLTFMNLYAYVGSDLGRRWFAGIIAVITYLLGDLFFLMGFDSTSRGIFFVTFLITNFIAQWED